MHNTETETPKRYQCRHIFTDGRRCGSPCLRGEPLCYYHHTNRQPAETPRARRSRLATFDLPLPEDQSAIQHSIGQVLQRIASNDIDPRRAGLLLYGLQIASLNLPKPPASSRNAKPSRESQSQPEIVEVIVHDPNLGPLAPESEYTRGVRPKSPVQLLMEKMLNDPEPDDPPPARKTPDPYTASLPVIRATEEQTSIATPTQETPPQHEPEIRSIQKIRDRRRSVSSVPIRVEPSSIRQRVILTMYVQTHRTHHPRRLGYRPETHGNAIAQAPQTHLRQAPPGIPQHPSPRLRALRRAPRRPDGQLRSRPPQPRSRTHRPHGHDSHRHSHHGRQSLHRSHAGPRL